MCQMMRGPRTWRPVSLRPNLPPVRVPWGDLLTDTCIPSGRPLLEPLAKEEIVRRRFQPPAEPGYERLGPRFSVAFSILMNVVRGPERALFQEFLSEVAKRSYVYEDHFRADLKAVESWVKVNGDFLPGWKILVGLNTCGGYLPAPPIEEFLDDVKVWVFSQTDFHPERSLPGWQDCFTEAVSYFFAGLGPLTPRRSVEDFLRSGDWARPGSANVPVAVTVSDVEGGEIKVRKTKDLLALSLPLQDLLGYFWQSRPTPGRALVKREATKARAVLITDLPSYLQMSWISDTLEPALKGNTYTSLLFSGGKLSELWIDMARKASDPAYWKLPVDQSHFDHNISLAMIETVIKSLAKTLMGPEFSAVISLILRSLVYEPPGVFVGSQLVQVNKGILSGWRWTALLDSVCNFGQVYGSYLWITRYVLAVYVYFVFSLVVQGDDARMLCLNPGLGIAVCEVMRACGFEINPNKTWLSPFRDEYLRKVAQNEGNSRTCRGYPARSMLSICWRNPINPPSSNLVLQVTGISQRWKELLARGADMGAVGRYFLRELKNLGRKYRVSLVSLERWAATPSWAGGLDWWWLGESYVSIAQIITPTHYHIQGLNALVVATIGIAALWRVPLTGTVWKDIRDKVSQTLQPYDPSRLSGIAKFEFKPVQHTSKGYAYPNRNFNQLCPVRAIWDPVVTHFRRGYPDWLLDTIMVASLRSGDLAPATVHAWQGMRSGFSEHIYRVHGKAIWLQWLCGQLDLPVRTWPGYGSAFVGGRVGVEKRLHLRRALTSSRALRLSGIDSLGYWFWYAQVNPLSYANALIGA